MSAEYIQVVTTVERREDADRIARLLVERRQAACVQIAGPIRSVYRWKGEIETAEEWQCWAKTRREFFDRVAETIRSLHPYEVPEILAMPIVNANAEYQQWLDEQL